MRNNPKSTIQFLVITLVLWPKILGNLSSPLIKTHLSVFGRKLFICEDDPRRSNLFSNKKFDKFLMKKRILFVSNSEGTCVLIYNEGFLIAFCSFDGNPISSVFEERFGQMS